MTREDVRPMHHPVTVNDTRLLCTAANTLPDTSYLEYLYLTACQRQIPIPTFNPFFRPFLLHSLLWSPQRIGEAYQILSDPQLRAAYDTRGKEAVDSAPKMDAGTAQQSR
jgi:hypothetical protein